MLGWAAGAGIDWRITPNLVLGALYLHYEFPKNTLNFGDSGGVSFNNTRQSVDAIKARLSVHFPIQ
jgi:opacity protein-like surface antigen